MLLKRVVTLVAAAALFAGCSPMPSTAVQVGDTRVTEAQVDRVVAGCESVGIGPDQVDRRTLAQFFGVDLNPTAVDLAEISLWLNTIYEGAFVPWFGLQLDPRLISGSPSGAMEAITSFSPLTPDP